MLTVLSELLESQVNVLQGKRLEAADFLALVAGDPIKDLLSWMNSPSVNASNGLKRSGRCLKTNVNNNSA